MRERNVQIKFFLPQEEVKFMDKKMQEAGIRNKSAYLRKMALDGYIIRIEFAELQKFIDALSRIGNNLNQIAKVANTYGEVSITEVHDFEAEIMKILFQAEKIVERLCRK